MTKVIDGFLQAKTGLQDIRVGLMDLTTGETNLIPRLRDRQPAAYGCDRCPAQDDRAEYASPTVDDHPRAPRDGSGDDGPWR